MAKRPPRHKVNHKQRAKAISALSRIVESPTAAEYVVAKAAAALLNTSARDDDLPESDDAATRKTVFLPRKVPLPGQREGESPNDFHARLNARAEGRRAAYCASLGEPYDAMRALPRFPYPTPGSDPALEDEFDRMADEWEAKEVERQRLRGPDPRHPPSQPLGPQPGDSNIIFYDSTTEAGRADRDRWKAEAEAAER